MSFRAAGLNLWQFLSFLTISFLSASLYSQVILTEVMYDPDTLEYHNEYVEIFNNGDAPASLQGWMIGDSLEMDEIRPHSGGLMLEPGKFAVILDSSYFSNSTTYNSLIPANVLLLTISDGSFGYAGWSNSRREWVLMVNAAGDTVQAYQYFPDNPPGYPDEKIMLNGSNSHENWGQGRRFRGTPGFRNSLTPLDFDLAVKNIWLTSPPARAGMPIPLGVQIINSGMQPANQFRVMGGVDQNVDSLLQSSEIVADSLIEKPLAPGDSLQLNYILSPMGVGTHLVVFQCAYSADMDLSNNQQLLLLKIVPANPEVIINEIMFQPLAGLSEWVELYNRGSDPVNLLGLQFADTRDTCRLAGSLPVIQPGEFKILSGDSAVINQYLLNAEDCIIASGFPTLNNDTDTLTLFSQEMGVLDMVGYSEDWFGREVVKGVSLERIDPEGSSAIPANWAGCVHAKGHTAGQPNSVYGKKSEKAIGLVIEPNPFSPDGDGFEDVTVFKVHSPVSTGYLSIDIFDMVGRRIRRLADMQPIGVKSAIVWDGKNSEGKSVRMGLYIVVTRWHDARQNQLAVKKTSVAVFKK